jgi:hypothetical protein
LRPRDREYAKRLNDNLTAFNRNIQTLPGIKEAARRHVFIEQLLESIHRVRFVEVVRARDISERRTNPNDALFDPLKAAIFHQRQGNIEEAFWLVFLFVHFGKNARGGWRYAREVYGGLGATKRWDWTRTSANPTAFREWLTAHQEELKRPGTPGGFGNHRKYESLSGKSEKGTGAAVESYVRWVDPPRTHQEMIHETFLKSDHDPRQTFDELYYSMQAVIRFGRTARFDYLTMLGKLDLAPVEAPSPYIEGASGPLRGGQLLFGEKGKKAKVELSIIKLGEHLHLGMQVLEDALCNWQKSPNKFKPFRG